MQMLNLQYRSHTYLRRFVSGVVVVTMFFNISCFDALADEPVAPKKAGIMAPLPGLQPAPFASPSPKVSAEEKWIRDVADKLMVGFFDLNDDAVVDSADRNLAVLAFTKMLFLNPSLTARQFQVFDGNQNGRMDLTDLGNFTAQFLSALDELASLFQLMKDVKSGLMDYDHNNTVNLEDREYAKEVFSLSQYFELDEFNELEIFVDQDQNGQFGASDETFFNVYVLGTFELDSRLAQYESGSMDADRDGDLDLQDLRQFVIDFRTLLTSAAVTNRDISKLDFNHDGRVDYDDRDDIIDDVLFKTGVDPYAGLDPRNSDPLGLADGRSVLFIDSENPNASTEANTGRAHYIEGAMWRQRALDANRPLSSFYLINQSGDPSVIQKLRSGDRVYVSGDQSMLDREMKFYTSGVTFRNYPGKDAILRFGLNNSGIPIEVMAHQTTWHGLEFVGNVQTAQGRVFSQNLFTSYGENTRIESCVFRESQGVPSGFLNTNDPNLVDIRYGLRKYRSGTVIPIGQQGWGNAVQLIRAHNSVIRNSTIQNRPTFNVTQISSHGLRVLAGQNYAIAGEGLLIEDSHGIQALSNTITHFGHQSLQIRRSSHTVVDGNNFSNPWNTGMSIYLSNDNIVRNNTIHDWAIVQRQLSTGAVYQAGNGIQIQGSSRNQIYGNSFFNATGSGAVIGLGSDPNQEEPPTDHNDIFNNSMSNVQTLAFNIGRLAGTYSNPTQASYENNNRFFSNLINNAHDTQGRVLMLRFQNSLTVGSAVGYGNQVFGNVIDSQGLVTPVSLYINLTLTRLTPATLNTYTFAADNLSTTFVALPGGDQILIRRTDTDLYGNLLPVSTTSFTGVGAL